MTSKAKPIRTAIVGLSANAVTSWAAQAHLPCILSRHGRKRFEITALLNSSEEAARAAVNEYGFDLTTTKAYGSVEDLANDPNVDLIIVNTRVDRHYESAIAAIRAGKDIYIEWPIAANMEQIEKLAEAALVNRNSKVAIGLQGRWAAPVLRLQTLLDSGKYGRLLSCNVRAFGGTKDRVILPTGLEYFAHRDVGGNPITIGFGHVIDFVQSLVGELDPEATSARLQTQRSRIPIRDPDTMNIVKEIDSNVPDHVSLHGRLIPSKNIVDDATLSMYYRRGQPFPGQPALVISLNCEKAEVVLTSIAGINLQADAYTEAVTIQAHEFATDKVVDVAWEWNDVQLDVPARARGVQQCLYAFADGDDNGWVSIDDAVRRAKQIDGWLNTHSLAQ